VQELTQQHVAPVSLMMASIFATLSISHHSQVGEVVRRLAELDEPGFAHILVKLVRTATTAADGVPRIAVSER